jgi:hypothetical protein
MPKPNQMRRSGATAASGVASLVAFSLGDVPTCVEIRSEGYPFTFESRFNILFHISDDRDAS